MDCIITMMLNRGSHGLISAWMALVLVFAPEPVICFPKSVLDPHSNITQVTCHALLCGHIKCALHQREAILLPRLVPCHSHEDLRLGTKQDIIGTSVGISPCMHYSTAVASRR